MTLKSSPPPESDPESPRDPAETPPVTRGPRDPELASLCHELRNPLAAIAHAADLLNEPAQEKEHDWALKMLRHQIGLLDRLVDDLLSATTTAAGELKLRPETQPLQDHIRAAAESVRPLLAKRRHTLVLDFPEEPLWIHADPARIEQIFTNLLVNACKYSDAQSTIHVRCCPKPGVLVARVRDKGIGIDPALLPRIFEPFVRGAAEEEGFGLGLRIVKQLTEQHGGVVIARSDGPGTGSEFELRFPAAEPPNDVPAQTGASSVLAEPARPSRVLLVDDNRAMAEALALLLRHEGHEVQVVGSGREAQEAARRDRPNLVLVDLDLPDLSGFELIRWLRGEDALRGAVFVAISGSAYDPSDEQFRRTELDGFLTKPVRLEPLRSLLQRRSEPPRGSRPGRAGFPS